MNWQKTIGILCAVLLTGCATYTNVSSKPSEDLLAPCAKLEAQPFDTFGDVVNAVAYTMEMYNICRARHSALIQFEREKK